MGDRYTMSEKSACGYGSADCPVAFGSAQGWLSLVEWLRFEKTFPGELRRLGCRFRQLADGKD
jgi:hypothetical protein